MGGRKIQWRRGLLVFAYGSNMCTARLRERTPGARQVATGFLDRHWLGFIKRGADGSGKATPVAGSSADSIPGVVFDVPAPEIAGLDRVEGGYIRRPVTIRTTDGSRDVLTYFADPSRIDHSLKPFQWYVELVRAGIREYGLPRSHDSAVANVPWIVDSNAHRRRHHLALAGVL